MALFRFIVAFIYFILIAECARIKIHIATIESWTYAPFGLPVAGAAIDMAVENIQETYNDTFEFTHTVHKTKVGATEIGAVASELYYLNKVDAFIGPGSSTCVQYLTYMAAQWNRPVITPNGGSVVLKEDPVVPILTRLAPINVGSYGSFYVELLNTYKWEHFVILYDANIFSVGQFSVLKSALDKTTKYTWTSYAMNYKTFGDEDYEYVLMAANTYARVFIVLSRPDQIRTFMLSAHRLGFTQGDHVMLTTTGYMDDVPESVWKQNDELDEDARYAMRSCLFLTKMSVQSTYYDDFETEVKIRALRDYKFDYKSWTVSQYVASYYDSFLIFAQVAREMVADGENPHNGTALTQRMWNRTFTGIGSRVVVNEKGIRDTDLELNSIDVSTGQFMVEVALSTEVKDMFFHDMVRLKNNCSISSGWRHANNASWPIMRLVVGQYEGDLGMYIQKKDIHIYWPNTRGPPPDVPECGFRNDQCSTEENHLSLISWLLAGLALIILVSFLVAYILTRRWKIKAESDLWWWKIDPSDLKLNSSRIESRISFLSQASVLSGKGDQPCLESLNNTAIYKGATVRLRQFPLSNVVLNTMALKELKQQRDLNHNNLVRVIGATLEEQSKFLVTEFCAKGTLQDLLGNSNVGLDTQFKFSMSMDIVQGMCFLHDSPVQKHGRLTSAVCLIDNRFSVKIADFGLDFLYSRLAVDKTSSEFKNECLWKAPEVLRDPAMNGTRAGDVYSFGILLLEVITREEPFITETETRDVDDILSRLKTGTNPPTRPKIEVPFNLTDLTGLMQSCWGEDPRRRPSFQVVMKTLRSLASRLGMKGNLLDNLLKRMEQYANNLEKLVDEKTVELKEEKKKSEELLYQILPRSVACRLCQGQKIDPEEFSCVTIYFSDICGFTSISARMTPFQVVDLLNDLYTCFDATIDRFDVYKVETIGDAYMVVSGLPQRNGNRHAVEIARMSLALLKAIETFTIRHLPEEKLRLRVGIHSGPVVAGVVGLKMPRYCLFGDTVNTASRMESHGEELRIHVSYATHVLISAFNVFTVELRGLTDIKGKGIMKTYWLLGEKPEAET